MTVGGTSWSGFQGQVASTPPTKDDMGKEAFLQLLVAQIRNQNPLNPADGTQFIAQLAQFSELEQVIQINQNIEAVRERYAPEEPADATTDKQQES
jgi:flagellar basal-body rod modification protein FlgD